ncbi:Ppx/GppA phosphatase [Xylaria bambusicola]|uniref:Ppx/GppA phosphatase n=1 Tax=Xylaria bambusicola TaxID=326684 RepID=UPI0020088A2B|nr:Ppx/GppA phosphatase [Xylaria bambusicola]KAI0526058.1 Ppx/GppA phosphatase [Xylaria bambusicola]
MKSVTDIVTLDNFASKMSPWDPNLPNHLYALVDMGSNGIRFSISDLSPSYPRLLKSLYRERAAISLFDALNESSSLGSPEFSPEVIARVSRTLARFKSIAVDFGVPSEHVSVFATEAMRKASNAASMLDAIFAESGLGVHVLAPEVETLFGAMGARSGFATVNGLFLDLGGGSVQMTYMNSDMQDYEFQAAKTGKSLPFGAARLINILEKNDVEVKTAALDELKIGMRDAFVRLQQEFPALRDTQASPNGSGVDIYLCGGGFRGYGSILMHSDPVQPYPIPAVGAYTVKGSFFCQTNTMRKTNAEYDGKIFGMSKRRRRQFPAIATVVDALVGTIPRIRTVTFCGGGNREGALYMKLPLSIREASPLTILHCGNDVSTLTLDAVVKTIQSALPSNVDYSNIPTVFTLGLGLLFSSEIWSRSGEPSEANASFQLHHALDRDPSVPGFSHLARCVLGLTLCFRWGATIGPADQQLFISLQRLVHQVNTEAVFWAEYIGEVARLLFQLLPRMPRNQDQLRDTVRFDAKVINGKNKSKIQLTISLNPALYHILDDQITDSFNKVGKLREGAKEPCHKVAVFVRVMES